MCGDAPQNPKMWFLSTAIQHPFFWADDLATMSRVLPALPSPDPRATIGHRMTTRRSSTIAGQHFPMYLIPLQSFRDRYGRRTSSNVGSPSSNLTPPRLDSWQVLFEQGLLVEATEVDEDAQVMFISHEWYGFNHPDKDRVKTETLIRVLDRLEKGEIPSVDMHWQDQLFFKDKTKTKKREWRKILSKAYLWFDWCCMPQPAAEKKDEISQEQMEKLREDGGNAIRSIPAYIELSDMVVVVAPSGYHADRREDTCVRSWRMRGWCNMELYACLFSRHKSCPVMVIDSAEGTPHYMNPGQAIFQMSIGRANFSCCQRNHRIVTATQSILAGEGTDRGDDDPDSNTIPCDKPVVRAILEPLIDAKIEFLFAEGNFVHARSFLSTKPFLLRGLPGPKPPGQSGPGTIDAADLDPVTSLKRKLRWREGGVDEKLARKSGAGMLYYAVALDQPSSVQALLATAKEKGTLKRDLCIADKANPQLGLPGGRTVLHVAIIHASVAVVTLLLDAGADPLTSVRDTSGMDGFKLACLFGRIDLIKMWLARYKNWNIERMDNSNGTALSWAGSIETITLLLQAGADITAVGPNGTTVLITFARSDNVEPATITVFLEHIQKISQNRSAEIGMARGTEEEKKADCIDAATGVGGRDSFSLAPAAAKNLFVHNAVNAKARPRSRFWKFTFSVAKFLYRCKLRKSGLVKALAHAPGCTALHGAASRGDVAAVRLLLDAGADPSIRNDLGLDVVSLSKIMGPFPAVEAAIQEHKKEG